MDQLLYLVIVEGIDDNYGLPPIPRSLCNHMFSTFSETNLWFESTEAPL